MNVLEWSGPAFLMAYVIAMVASVPISAILSRLARPSGRSQPLADPDSLAYLAGKNDRLADGVTTRMLASGAISFDGTAFTRGTGKASAASERAVLALPSPFRWKDIQAALKPEGAAIERRLEAGGLLLDAGERRRVAMISVAPLALLLIVGGTKLLVGLSRGKPILFLAILLVITLVWAIGRWVSVDNQTRAGRAALKEARQKHDRLKRAPTTGETGLAVALFGTTVLAGSALSDFHRSRSSDGGGWSDSSSSSSSDSGCGGSSSGCGGCGGGGD